jgi:hypothetical protein
MRFKIGCAVMLACCVSGAAFAQIVSPVHLLPVVAKVAGSEGTNWMTSVTISNSGDQAADVNAMFFPENETGSLFPGIMHQFRIAAGRTMEVQDVLGSWFPAEGNTKGTMLMLAEAVGGSEDDNAKLAVTARVFNNADPNFTYGQTVPSSFLSLIVGRGASVLPGARWDSVNRSNVGVLNLSLQPLKVIITTYTASGAVAAEVKKTIKAFSMNQWGLNQLGVNSMTASGRVEVRIDPSSISWDPCTQNVEDIGGLFGMFVAYMSRVDNASGDAVFLLGQPDWEGYVDECGEEPDDCKSLNLARKILNSEF